MNMDRIEEMIEQRKERGLTEIFTLIDTRKDDNYILTIHSSGELYNIIINNFLYIECNCKDMKHRRILCKHIYFIIGVILKLDLNLIQVDDNARMTDLYPNLYTLLDKLTERFKFLHEASVVSSNDCMICLNTMSGRLTECPTCHNTSHLSCLLKWKQIKRVMQCPLCRSVYNTEQISCLYQKMVGEIFK